MPDEKTQQYNVPPMVEQLAAAAGLNAQMLKETRDYLADSLARNHRLVLEQADLKREITQQRQRLEEAEDKAEVSDSLAKDLAKARKELADLRAQLPNPEVLP